MEEDGAVVDFEGGKMSFSYIGRAPRAQWSEHREHRPHNFPPGQRGTQPEKKVAWQTDEQLPASHSREKNAPQNRIWLVKARENISLPPRCSQIVAGKLEIGKEQTLPLVCMGPAQIHIKGIFLARTHSSWDERTPNFPSDVTTWSCWHWSLQLRVRHACDFFWRTDRT